jgi:hypothetical protein
MTGFHLLATLGGLVILLASPFNAALDFVGIALLQFFVPAVTVAYRASQTGSAKRLAEGLILYWYYYWARIHALALLAMGRNHQFAK